MREDGIVYRYSVKHDTNDEDFWSDLSWKL